MARIRKHSELNALKGKIRAEKTNYKEVAIKMGIEISTLNNKINGYTAFNISEAEKMVEILNIDVENINFYFFPEMPGNVN